MKMKKVLPLSLAGALAVALTACNLTGLPTNTNVASEGNVEGTIKPNIGKPTIGTPGSVQTNPNLANSFAKPNASVSGKLLDAEGKPVADAFVFAANGQVAKTDAQGNYSIAVTAEAGKEVNLIFQKQGYVFSSERVLMSPGDKALMDTNVKKLDSQSVTVNALTGGSFKNSTGVLEVDIPANAMNSNGTMTMTPLNFGQNGLTNDLPGALETVDETGSRMLLMPAEYWSIDLQGTTLKEGETITMRMRLPENPTAPVKLKAGDMIPCYIYDAELGYWNSPNLGPVIEKDGALWATYEIKASALTNRAEAARKIQQVYTGSAGAPLSDAQLQANAAALASGAATFGTSSFGGGVIGGHTFYPLFGTTQKIKVEDEKGNGLGEASVSISGGGNPGSAGHAGGGVFQRLQYRGQSVTVRARLNDYCDESGARQTASSSKVAAPLNQFGYSTGDLMEGRAPEFQDWTKITLDTRHPATISVTGTAAGTAPSALTYTLKKGNAAEAPITFATLGTKNLDRGAEYTLAAKSGSVDKGSATTKFTIPTSYEKGKPFAIELKFALDAEAIK